MRKKFHPHIKLRQNETPGQGFLSRAFDAVEEQSWERAKYWFNRAIQSGETCPKAFGEVGLAACDAILSLESPTPEQAQQVYLDKQKELSSTIPTECLV